MFQDWENYYFLIGSAGAGLIGLLFVVVTLTAGFERSRALRGATLYMTPTALHFALVFSMSAVAVAPNLPTPMIATVFAFAALVGIVVAIRSAIGIRTRPPSGEPPHWTDAWFYGIVPGVLYLAIFVTAVMVGEGSATTAYALAALLLLLLLVSIRNAWDLVTYIAPMRQDPPPP